MNNKVDEILARVRLQDEARKQEKGKTVLWILAIIGCVAAVAAIAYAVYRFFTPDYLEDFEDEFEDEFEDDFFEDDEDDEIEEYVIPVYTDEDEANEAIETFKEQFGENEFACDKKSGNEIVADYAEDEGFLGLASNAPQWDFVIGGEEVHDCCE